MFCIERTAEAVQQNFIIEKVVIFQTKKQATKNISLYRDLRNVLYHYNF